RERASRPAARRPRRHVPRLGRRFGGSWRRVHGSGVPSPTPVPGRRSLGPGPGVVDRAGGNVSGVTALSLTRELRRCGRALCGLGAGAERAQATLTVPADRVTRTWLAGTAVRPAVDPDLWDLHVRYARTRDEATLAALVERYRPHAEAQARRLY